MTLQIYVLRQLLVGMVFAVGGMFFVAVPGIAINAVGYLGGVGMTTFLGYMPLAGMSMLPYLAPIGYLLAVVSTYGRLAADNEWTAIVMAGVHPLRMLVPPLLLAVGLGGGTYWLLSNVSPNLLHKQRGYLRESVAKVFTNLSPGRTDLAIGRFRLFAQYREGDVFYDVIFHVPGVDGGENTTLSAERVRPSVQGSQLWIEMEDARTVKGNLDVSSGNPTVRIDLDKLFETPTNPRKRPKYKTTERIREDLATGTLEPGNARSHVYEIHKRYATGTLYLMFLLLGAPTGLLLRQGTQLAALASAVGYALVYYMLSMRLGHELLKMGAISPAMAAWCANGVGFAFGLWLSLRAFRR